MYEFLRLSLDVNVASVSSGRISIRPDQKTRGIAIASVYRDSIQLCMAEADAEVRQPLSGLLGDGERISSFLSYEISLQSLLRLPTLLPAVLKRRCLGLLFIGLVVSLSNYIPHSHRLCIYTCLIKPPIKLSDQPYGGLLTVH